MTQIQRLLEVVVVIVLIVVQLIKLDNICQRWQNTSINCRILLTLVIASLVRSQCHEIRVWSHVLLLVSERV